MKNNKLYENNNIIRRTCTVCIDGKHSEYEPQTDTHRQRCVWIGANVTITAGVTIGDKSFKVNK